MGDPIKEGRERAESFNGKDGSGFKNVGRLNAYQCETCLHYAITIDREPGVTPFIVRCRRCGGEAKSAFYRVPPTYQPTYEWIRPETVEGLDSGTIEHIRSGGLILRPINPDRPQWTAPKTRFA